MTLKSQNTSPPNIEPVRWYTFLQIVALGVLGASHHTVRHNILKDKFGKDILQTKMAGEGKGSRYLIQGKNIIKYLEVK